jgi:hypothetical protein
MTIYKNKNELKRQSEDKNNNTKAIIAVLPISEVLLKNLTNCIPNRLVPNIPTENNKY